MTKKILILMGTRPEAIKLIPLYLELKRNDFKVELVSTGQHLDMIKQVLDFFNVTLDSTIKITRLTNSLAELTAQLFIEIENLLVNNRPDLVIVQGDTTSAYVGSMCAFYNKIPVAHIEAGLRTNNKYSPFPEEINRTIISEIADFHFAPTSKNASNLLSLNKQNVFVTGNTVIDALQLAKPVLAIKAEKYQAKFADVVKGAKMNILITGHRRESFGHGFQEICEAIRDLSKEYSDYNFIYPVHLNPQVKEIVHQYLENISNVYLIEPLAYDDLLFIMSNSKLILTDSGGIQEEAPSFNIPLVVMRNETERQEGIDANCSVLAGTQKESIVASFHSIMRNTEVYNKMATAKNPYGDGTASKQIVEILKNKLGL